LLQPVPLTAAIAWNAVFIAINAYWIVRLILGRRPVHLTPDEARLRQLSFPSLTPREARDLFATGAWDEVAPEASLVEHDKRDNRFSVILRCLADETGSVNAICFRSAIISRQRLWDALAALI
jgi:hypothetical protein